MMENNLNFLTPSFSGTSHTNGLPQYAYNGLYTIGGFQDTKDSQTAYFGRVVTINYNNNKNTFSMGKQTGNLFAGILVNEQNIRENDPAIQNYIISGIPATIDAGDSVYYLVTAEDGVTTRTYAVYYNER
jgi:hypothetical protein